MIHILRFIDYIFALLWDIDRNSPEWDYFSIATWMLVIALVSWLFDWLTERKKARKKLQSEHKKLDNHDDQLGVWLFKEALGKQICFINDDERIEWCTFVGFRIKDTCNEYEVITDICWTLDFSKYGKTWALNTEDLDKQYRVVKRYGGKNI